MCIMRGDRVRILVGPGQGKTGRVVFSDATTGMLTVSLDDVVSSYINVSVESRNCEKLEGLFWNDLINSVGM